MNPTELKTILDEIFRYFEDGYKILTAIREEILRNTIRKSKAYDNAKWG